MSTEAVDVALSRVRVRRSPAAHVQRAEEKERVYLSLNLAAASRLRTHAGEWRRDKGDIVSELINAHLREFVIHRRRKGENGEAATLPDE